MSGLFEDLKNEIKKRKVENNDLERAISAEKQRIEEARAEAKKNIFRKIAFVDKIGTKKDQEADEEQLRQFKEKESKNLSALRADRRKEIISAHKKSLLGIVLAVVVIIAGVCVAQSLINKSKLEKNYNSAIAALINDKYEDAIDTLDTTSYKDSRAIVEYAKILQSETDDPKYAADLLSKLEVLQSFENDDLRAHYNDTIARLTKIKEDYEEKIRQEAKAKEEAEAKARAEAEARAKAEAERKAQEEAEKAAKAKEEEERLSQYLKISAADLDVATMTDYAHIKGGNAIPLGNNEGVTITVSSKVKEMTPDDLYFYYDDSYIKVKVSPVEYYEDKAIIQYYVTGKKAGNTELVLLTLYDIAAKGENAEGYTFEVIKRDSKDGRIVYVTDTGEKYHYSEKCAGDGAIKTTLYDALSYEYDPCGKCVN